LRQASRFCAEIDEKVKEATGLGFVLAIDSTLTRQIPVLPVITVRSGRPTVLLATDTHEDLVPSGADWRMRATSLQELEWHDEFWSGDPQQLGHVVGVNQLLVQLR